MLGFYRTAAYTLLCLILSSILILYAGVKTMHLGSVLLPAQERDIPWTPRLVPAAPEESGTRIGVRNDNELLDYDFELAADVLYPYTSYTLDFVDIAQPDRLIDLTRYHGLSFKVRCEPQNVLLLVLFTRDEKATIPTDHSTYRVSSGFFSCGENWNTVDMSFKDLHTPDWWLQQFRLPLTDQAFRLDRVFGLGFVNSLQSPRLTPSNVKISDLRVVGQDPRRLYAAMAVAALLWLFSFIWLFRRYVAALVAQVQENVKRDLPLVAYQKLTIEPRADKEKAAVISFMAKEYANHDLDLETAVNSLGINRNKINDILKNEIGLTFSGYLNKLRLTEAARLLLEERDVNVAEIAFAVGYNNVNYFNKLFKTAYGCTPKSFKTLYQSPPANAKD